MTNCKFALVLCAVILLAFPSPARAQTAPFRKGETIRFSVKQSVMKMGEATLVYKGGVERNGKKYDLIVFTAKGFNFYDEESIFVDPVTFLPQVVARDLNIFGNKEKITEEYEQALGRIKVTKRIQGREPVTTVIEKKGAIDNIYGFIYRYRMQKSPVKGETFDVRLPTLDLKISGVKDVELKVGGKKYDAVLLSSVPSKYSIWMDKSEKHLPLRIGGAIGIANTVMTMIEYKE